MIKKIFRVVKAIFSGLYKVLDKCVVTPISKLIYRLMSLGKDQNGKIEKILNRPIILLYISLLCAILIFCLIDRKIITLVDNEAEIISGQKINMIYNEESYVVEGLPETVDITLIGTKSNLYLAKQLGDHQVVLDLTGYSAGSYKVRLKYNHSLMNNINYKLDPSTVSIKISKKESQVFNLTYDLLNQKKLDSKLSIKNVTLEKNEVTVKGSKETLEKVANVKALIDLEKAGLTSKGEFTVDSITLVAYDTEGNKVPNVEIVPNKISANIKVDSYSVELPVKIVTTGSVTTGYALSSISSSVTKVTVYGEQETLEKLTSIEAKIDISDLNSDKTFNGIVLTKPAGVRDMSDTTTSITITLDKEKSKEFKDIAVESKNLANGLIVSAVSENDRVITVTVKGVESALENLDQSKIKAYIDLSGYTSTGTYDVDVKISIDDPKFTVVSSSTKVKVKISKE